MKSLKRLYNSLTGGTSLLSVAAETQAEENTMTSKTKQE